MVDQQLLKGIEKILDDWDPIGVLEDVKPIDYSTNAIGEYSGYINDIIEVYFYNNSLYNYLLNLYSQLRDDPNEAIKEEIKMVAKRLNEYLSSNFSGSSNC